MQIKNLTSIPNEKVREIIRFARPPGIKNFDVMLRNAHGRYAGGRAYSHGSRYHYSARPFIVIRLPRDTYPQWAKTYNGERWLMSQPPFSKEDGWTRIDKQTFPLIMGTYQLGQLRGKRYHVVNRSEYLLYITAHELRHLWQRATGSRRKGMVWGARGIASEIDTESYAIRKLREWRRREKVLHRIKDCAIPDTSIQNGRFQNGRSTIAGNGRGSNPGANRAQLTSADANFNADGHEVRTA